MNVTIHLTDQPNPETRTRIVDALIAFNVAAAGVNDFHPLAVLLSDDTGETVGGLWGRTVFGWLYVELLFVLNRCAAVASVPRCFRAPRPRR